MRRTEEEKADILRRWKEREDIRANERMISEQLGIPIPQKPMSFNMADNGATNPNYSADRSYRINCQCCVVSHELRMRGWDVEAVPNLEKGIPLDLSHKTQLAWIDRATNAAPVLQRVTSNTSEDVVDKLVNAIKEPGRYSIQWNWKGKRSGHIICGELKEDGSLFFYDPQARVDGLFAKQMNKEEFYSLMGNMISPKGDGIEFYRVDNLNLSPAYGVKAVKKK
jgi:hypothetical protein